MLGTKTEPKYIGRIPFLDENGGLCPSPRSRPHNILVTHLVTHLVWPHQPENPPGRSRA